MTCWQQLSIDQTADIGAIKKAYAILLKKNRPDENPEGFKQLNTAYKQCLVAAKKNTSTPQNNETQSQIINPPPQETKPKEENTINTSSTKVGAEFSEPPIESSPPSNESKKAEQVQKNDVDNRQFEHAKVRITKLTQQALSTMQRQDSIDAWQFIAHDDALYDIEFKTQYSHYLLEQWLEFLKTNTIAPKERSKSLLYINDIFQWQSQARHLEEHYTYEIIAPIFDILSTTEGIQEQSLKWTVTPKHTGIIKRPNYYSRIAATIIDIFILCLIFYSIPTALGSVTLFLYAITLFMGVNAIFEASPMQGSLGKVLFGLKVTNKQGHRINIIHSLWRQISYIACTASIKITMWINLFLGDGRLLHDRISLSRVIKRQ